MLPQQLCRATQSVVYSIATAYGFQLFNLDQERKEWVTATAGLAADQLVVLLRDAAVRRLAAQDGSFRGWHQGLNSYVKAWKLAVQDVHSEYFQEYNIWQTNLGLPDPEAQQHDAPHHPWYQGLQEDNKHLLQLLELSLQFCIYTESANLRHTPHLLCLVYYIMRSSTKFKEVFAELTKRADQPPPPPQRQQQQQPPRQTLPHTHWQYWLQFSAEDFPAAAIQTAPKPDRQQGSQDAASSSSSKNHVASSAGNAEQQPRATIVAGAWDITLLRRSLVQQLYDAAPGTFNGPAASAVRRSPSSINRQQQQQQEQAGVLHSGKQPPEPLPAASSSNSRMAAELVNLGAEQRSILVRVAAGQHYHLVEQLLKEITSHHALGLTPQPPAAVDSTRSSWMRDQQQYLRLVVQPLFFFLAEQIDLAGQQAEEDPSLRIAYDDVNEHCCSPASVKQLLTVLKREYPQAKDQAPATVDLWSALDKALNAYAGKQRWQDEAKGKAKKLESKPGSGRLTEPEPVVKATSRYPRDYRREDVLRRLAQVLQQQQTADAEADGADTKQVSASAAAQQRLQFEPAEPIAIEAVALNEVYEFARSGADWWAINMFTHKTFVEARSIASPFVAFWRVYAFHAALLTLMGALAYIWETWPAKQPPPWTRIIAAFLLTTITDALMRAARAGAYMMLAMYTLWRVKRKVRLWVAVDAANNKRSWFGSNPSKANAADPATPKKLEIRDVVVDLNPFPAGSFKELCLRLVQLLVWLGWAGFLGIFLAMQVTDIGNQGFIDLLQKHQRERSPRFRFAVFVSKYWVLPALVHVVVVWGASLLRQRNGFVARNVWQSLRAMPAHLYAFCRVRSAPPAHQGAYARCSSDPRIDALFFPASNLRIDAARTWANFGMWVLVILIKFVFELLLVIIPLVKLMRTLLASNIKGLLLNALQLKDANQPPAETASDVLILVALSVPAILMSFSDTGMFFSVVGALVSAGRGFKRAVGSIRHWSDLVQSFEVLQQQYLRHCMSEAAMHLHIEDTSDPHAVQQASMCALAAGWNALVLDLRQRDLLDNRELAVLMFEQLQLTHSQKLGLLGMQAEPHHASHLKRLRLTTVLPARCFLAGAVGELASGALGTTHHLWVAQAVWGWLLWVLWQTGILHKDVHLLLDSSDDNNEQKKTLKEKAHQDARKHLIALSSLRLLHPVQLPGQTDRWTTILNEAVRLLQLLSKGSMPSNLGVAAAELLRSQGVDVSAAGSRPTGLLHGLPLKQRELREAARDLAHAVNNLINLVMEELEEVRASPRLRHAINMTESEMLDVRKALEALKKRWGTAADDASKEEERLRQDSFADIVSTDGLLPQNDQLEDAAKFIAASGRASDGPAQVVRYLTDVLTMYGGDTEPADEEAVRFILSFASSLKDPELGTAPSLQECPTLSTLVPHYNEDVLYALSEDDALADLQVADPSKLDAKPKGEMLYLMSPEGSSTPTLSYLRSVYNTSGEAHSQWANFTERIKALAPARGISAGDIPRTIYEYHFLPGGPLHPLKQELLLWASWRGQLLARTVRGLMSYRTALQAQARHENPQFLHLGLQQAQQAQQAHDQQHQRPPAASPQLQQQRQAQTAPRPRQGLFSKLWNSFPRGQRQPHQQLMASTAQPAAPAARPLQEELDILADKQRLLRNQQHQLQEQIDHSQTQLDAEQHLQQDLHQQQAALKQQNQKLPEVKGQLQQLQRQLGCLGHLLTSRKDRLAALQSDLTDTKAQLQQAEMDLQPLKQQQQYWEAFRDVMLDDLVDCKYHLVVSSQNLGVFASKQESSKNIKSAWLAHSVEVLRERHPTFKVAFIDKQLLVTASRPGHKVEVFRHASVLLTSHHRHKLAAAAGLPTTQQAYRVLLPVNFESGRGVVLGEGKPENQNHAIVFCPGEALQTIDCNQDNIVAEGLKLRNLLAELLPREPDSGRRKGQHKQVALVGFREWVFSQDSGALAEFAAATERSFGSTVQRVMYNPGAVRFHYGHPDVWRRVFVSTAGGVSKANKSQHVSEDVFGGYNVVLRGQEIVFRDYLAVGKGRDMANLQINTFEAKIAAGNGEQVLSRDVRRLGHNMSFFRLMTWYHTGNGFFINTALNMVSVHASLWAYLLLALGKYSNAEVQATLSTVQLLQLGTLSTLVYLFTLGLEIGLFRSVWTIVRQMLQGSLMFYIFRAQTTAYSFTYDLLFGGAKYLPTGRGYSLAPTSLKELYRRYGRSHFYFGAVLLQYAVACIAAGHEQGLKLLVLWGPLLVALSLTIGPFWFTPFAFRTSTVTADMAQMQSWFSSPSPDPANSWSAWNADAWRKIANADGKQQGRFGVAIHAILMKLASFLMMLAAASRMKRPKWAGDKKKNDGFPSYAMALIMASTALLFTWLVVLTKRHQAQTGLRHHSIRIVGMVLTVVLVVGLVTMGYITSGTTNFWEIRNSSNTALVAFGTVLMLRLLPLVFYIAPKFLGPLCSSIYYVGDVVLIAFLNGLRFVLSLFDILTGLQAQLLFSTAYARQVMADASLQHSMLPKLVKQALEQHKVARMQRLRQAAVQQAQQ